jgi:hypothetical protein
MDSGPEARLDPWSSPRRKLGLSGSGASLPEIPAFAGMTKTGGSGHPFLPRLISALRHLVPSNGKFLFPRSGHSFSFRRWKSRRSAIDQKLPFSMSASLPNCRRYQRVRTRAMEVTSTMDDWIFTGVGAWLGNRWFGPWINRNLKVGSGLFIVGTAGAIAALLLLG